MTRRVLVLVLSVGGCEAAPASPSRDEPRVAPPVELSGLPDIQCPGPRTISITSFLLAPLFASPDAEDGGGTGIRLEYPPDRLAWVLEALLFRRRDGEGQCVRRLELSL